MDQLHSRRVHGARMCLLFGAVAAGAVLAGCSRGRTLNPGLSSRAPTQVARTRVARAPDFNRGVWIDVTPRASVAEAPAPILEAAAQDIEIAPESATVGTWTDHVKVGPARIERSAWAAGGDATSATLSSPAIADYSESAQGVSLEDVSLDDLGEPPALAPAAPAAGVGLALSGLVVPQASGSRCVGGNCDVPDAPTE